MWRDFKAFLLKQNVIALAIAVVVGNALNKLVTSLVDSFIMPIVGAITPGGTWEQWTYEVAGASFRIGDFLGALVNFFIIGLVAWRISRILIRPPRPDEKPATKKCPYCRMELDVEATRCAHCTSALTGAPAAA